MGDIYRVYSVHKVENRSGDRVYMLRLRNTNTSGVSSPFIGDWSVDSPLWTTLDSMTRQNLVANLETSDEFFMSFTDWMKTFNMMEIVHLDADTARDEPSLNGKKTLKYKSLCWFNFYSTNTLERPFHDFFVCPCAGQI